MAHTLWSNNKTGDVYEVQTLEAINCTANADNHFVVYTKGNLTFVREREEFLTKFTKTIQLSGFEVAL